MQSVRPGPRILIVIGASLILLLYHTFGNQSEDTPMTTDRFAIPTSIQKEHDVIHSTLVEATKAPGRVGDAARKLAEVLHPHFVREEQIALPPLGLLARLVEESEVSDSEAELILAMTDSLRRELPGMMEEHKQIRAAVDVLRQAAAAEGAIKYQELADQLALHALNEEEVLYPAAVLVGDLIRVRIGTR
jgi:iron-sulfur cluster repair protein YtfE (RIC family)